MATRCTTSWAYVAAVLLLTGVSAATAKYSGGTGEPNDPYQIATAVDLIALGEDPNDYDKHFILTADIDLTPISPAARCSKRRSSGRRAMGAIGVLMDTPSAASLTAMVMRSRI